jgi:hypothetical protein
LSHSISSKPFFFFFQYWDFISGPTP